MHVLISVPRKRGNLSKFILGFSKLAPDQLKRQASIGSRQNQYWIVTKYSYLTRIELRSWKQFYHCYRNSKEESLNSEGTRKSTPWYLVLYDFAQK